jgi:hypothetical protein
MGGTVPYNSKWFSWDDYHKLDDARNALEEYSRSEEASESDCEAAGDSIYLSMFCFQWVYPGASVLDDRYAWHSGE